jgi:hypothetical protein
MKITGVLLVSLVMACPMVTAHSVQCGDMNGNGTVDVSDLVSLVAYMFQSGPSPEYLPAADCNGSGSLDISDIVCWVEWMFGGGQTPPACPIDYLQNHEEFSSGCLPEPAPGKDAAETATSAGYL